MGGQAMEPGAKRAVRGAGSARTSAALALVALTLVAAPARADFGSVKHVFNGTAYTLEQGQFAVGIVSPIEYGLLDELTLVTHPILDLLLVPNFAIKWKVVDRAVALAMNVAYVQTFLGVSQLSFPGSATVFPTLSVAFGSSVALSFQAGYVLDVLPRKPAPIGRASPCPSVSRCAAALPVAAAADEGQRLDHGVSFGGNVALLLGPSDLLWIGIQGQWYAGSGIAIPTAIVSYTHAFYRMRLSVGVAAGHFPTQVGTNAANILDLPVYPVIDLWWLL